MPEKQKTHKRIAFVVPLRQELMEILGADPVTSMVLTQMVYWQNKADGIRPRGTHGTFRRSSSQFVDDLFGGFSLRVVQRAILQLKEGGFILEHPRPKGYSNTPTYTVNFELIRMKLAEAGFDSEPKWLGRTKCGHVMKVMEGELQGDPREEDFNTDGDGMTFASVDEAGDYEESYPDNEGDEEDETQVKAEKPAEMPKRKYKKTGGKIFDENGVELAAYTDPNTGRLKVPEDDLEFQGVENMRPDGDAHVDFGATLLENEIAYALDTKKEWNTPLTPLLRRGALRAHSDKPFPRDSATEFVKLMESRLFKQQLSPQIKERLTNAIVTRRLHPRRAFVLVQMCACGLRSMIPFNLVTNPRKFTRMVENDSGEFYEDFNYVVGETAIKLEYYLNDYGKEMETSQYENLMNLLEHLKSLDKDRDDYDPNSYDADLPSMKKLHNPGL